MSRISTITKLYKQFPEPKEARRAEPKRKVSSYEITDASVVKSELSSRLGATIRSEITQGHFLVTVGSKKDAEGKAYFTGTKEKVDQFFSPIEFIPERLSFAKKTFSKIETMTKVTSSQGIESMPTQMQIMTAENMKLGSLAENINVSLSFVKESFCFIKTPPLSKKIDFITRQNENNNVPLEKNNDAVIQLINSDKMKLDMLKMILESGNKAVAENLKTAETMAKDVLTFEGKKVDAYKTTLEQHLTNKSLEIEKTHTETMKNLNNQLQTITNSHKQALAKLKNDTKNQEIQAKKEVKIASDALNKEKAQLKKEINQQILDSFKIHHDQYTANFNAAIEYAKSIAGPDIIYCQPVQKPPTLNTQTTPWSITEEGTLQYDVKHRTAGRQLLNAVDIQALVKESLSLVSKGLGGVGKCIGDFISKLTSKKPE